jgi:mutator protein MutT
MTLRHKEQELGGLWETPGGKVEPGEAEREALYREMREELGIVVSIGPLISLTTFNWGRRINMLLYVCTTRAANAIKPLASQEFRWLDPTYVSEFPPCVPSFYAWHSDIMNYLERS